MRHIEIDLEIHKLIEQERVDFSETENAILRRLLRLKVLSDERGENSIHDGWSAKDVYLPNGTKLKMQYKGRVIEGEIADGRWKVAGVFYTSPTGAAKKAALIADPSYDGYAMNGWHYWQVLKPGMAEFRTLSSLT